MVVKIVMCLLDLVLDWLSFELRTSYNSSLEICILEAVVFYWL